MTQYRKSSSAPKQGYPNSMKSLSDRLYGLLVKSPAMFEPARLMTPLRIVMRPVQHAAFGVPLVFAIEMDKIAHLQRCDARRKVDVMRYQ